MKDFSEHISILLSEPEGPINLGFISRAMANTGFDADIADFHVWDVRSYHFLHRWPSHGSGISTRSYFSIRSI